MMKRSLLLLASLCLAGCLGTTDATNSSNSPSDPAHESFATSLGVNISQMKKVGIGSDTLYYKDLSVGSGPTLTTPTSVIVTYAGFLSNGFLFDTGTSVQFTLSQTVPGFQQGMLGMNTGGERLIVIPSNLGYGPFAVGRVPPNSTLVFDVRLEQIP